jgi:hypothetical protein
MTFAGTCKNFPAISVNMTFVPTLTFFPVNMTFIPTNFFFSVNITFVRTLTFFCQYHLCPDFNFFLSISPLSRLTFFSVNITFVPTFTFSCQFNLCRDLYEFSRDSCQYDL